MNRLNVARMQSPGLDTAIVVLKAIVILAGVVLAVHTLAGCGGTAFSTGGGEFEDAGPDAPREVSASDGSNGHDGLGVDAATDAAAGDEHQSTPDGGGAPETGGFDVSAPETGVVETGPTCTAFTGDINYCTINDTGAVPRWLVLENVGVAPGGGITVLNCVVAKTPDACTCLETYDCACILPAWTCSDGTAPVGCVDGPAVAVQCQ
jgi:hypothetical protein